MTFTSATILLFLVIDPFGSIPLFISALKNVEEGRRLKLVLRECAVAFVVLAAALFAGQKFLDVMQVSQTSLGMAGGIILFIIALRIIFPPPEGVFGDFPDGEPYIVPLAIPLIAGPSALATVLLLAARQPELLWQWFGALVLAVTLSTIILVLGSRLTKFLGERGVIALERLVGLIITTVAVEMFLNGLKDFVHQL